MFNIELYSTSDGVSELWDFLEDLQNKALTNKDARIQHKQISQYIQLLADHGTRLGHTAGRKDCHQIILIHLILSFSDIQLLLPLENPT